MAAGAEGIDRFGAIGAAAAVAALMLLVAVTPVGTGARGGADGGTGGGASAGHLADEESRRRDLEKTAEALEQELSGLRLRLVQLADDAGLEEDRLADLETVLEALEGEERVYLHRLEANRSGLAQLTDALIRLTRTPPESLLARPGAAKDTVRSGLLLRTMLPVLSARADAFRATLSHLQSVRSRLVPQRQRVMSARARLAERREEIAGMMARREDLFRRTRREADEAAERVAKLQAKSGVLREFLGRSGPPVPEVEESVRTEKQALNDLLHEQALRHLAGAGRGPGAFRLPVTGRILVGFGQRDRFGNPSRGVHVAIRPGATIVAPYDGTVMFAGPFRGYGRLLIVEHASGYHSLIAGLGTIETAVGRHVSAGEPVGTMAAAPAADAASVYFELRRDGKPINPRSGIESPGRKG